MMRSIIISLARKANFAAIDSNESIAFTRFFMNNKSFLRTWVIGDRKFYKMVITLLIPIILQNTVSNFVNLLDNLMIGQVGTDQMSGVAIVNQLMMVFNLTVFGALGTPSIFASQFYGKKDDEGVRNTLRFKLLLMLIVVIGGLFVFIGFGTPLINLFLTDGSAGAQAALRHAQSYLSVMLWGLLPFAISNAYASHLRSVGQTFIPMISGIAAMLTNLVGNYILIFGHFGAPAMGVTGAAVATVISRFVEMAIVVVYAHKSVDRFPFMKGLYRKLTIPGNLAKTMLIKGLPLLANEVLWSLGMTTMTQCYSTRGYMVIAALNIASTISNVFMVMTFACGDAVAILVGQKLGSGEIEEAKHTAWKLAIFNVITCIVISSIMALFSGVVPNLYNTEPEIRALATNFLRVSALAMPLVAFAHCCYFTLRSGGKMLITFIFDSGFMWCLSIPLAMALTRMTNMPIIPLYLTIQMLELPKCILGFFMMKKGNWANNMVQDY